MTAANELERYLGQTSANFYTVDGQKLFPVYSADGSIAAKSMAIVLGSKFEESDIAKYGGPLGLGGKVGEGSASAYVLNFFLGKTYTIDEVFEMVEEAVKACQ